MSDLSISLSKNTVLHEICSEITVKWKIADFFDLPLEHGCFLDSPIFVMSRAQWFLRLFPNGALNRHTDSIGLFLSKQSPKCERFVSFEIAIKQTDGSMFKRLRIEHNFNQKEADWGWHHFAKRSELLLCKDNVAPNGILTVCCNVRFKGDVVSQESFQTSASNSSVQTLSQNFKELYFSGSHADVTIKIKDREFIAHKLVLATRSSVFRAMFEADMAEKNSGVINIVDCDPAYFECFLLFIYSGQLDIVSSHNALGLYLLADKYNLIELKQACSRCLAQEVSVDSVCDIVHLATLHDEPELLKTATYYFIKHANIIFSTQKWLSFIAEHHIMANELLKEMANKYIR